MARGTAVRSLNGGAQNVSGELFAMRIFGLAFGLMGIVGRLRPCPGGGHRLAGGGGALGPRAHPRRDLVRLLKTYGDDERPQPRRSDLRRGESRSRRGHRRALVALAKDEQPATLPDLEARLERGVKGREAFCAEVMLLVPDTSGEKNVIVDLVSGALGPVIEAVKEIYFRAREDANEQDRLTRLTIQTQLEATKWPAFADILSPTDRPSGAVLARAGALAGVAETARPLRPPDAGPRSRHAHRDDLAGRCRRRGALRGDRLGRQDGAGLVGRGRPVLRTIRLPAGPGDVGKASPWRSARTASSSPRVAGPAGPAIRKSRSTSSTAQPADARRG